MIWKIRSFGIALILIVLALPPVIGQQVDAYLETTSFDLASLSTRSENLETILHVTKQGRYSIQAESPTGARIELVDRMAGVMSDDGQAGARDGRIDIVLERGEYKIRVHPDKENRGSVELRLFCFEEKHPAVNRSELPLLLDQQSITTTLADLEQRSYWIHMPETDVLHLEIMGRSLSACRLWHHGQWLEDVSPIESTLEAEPGRPMTHLEFSHPLEAGYYLLVCYGGPSRPWANDSGDRPLLLRRGVVFLGEAGSRRIRISPFGRDVFWVSGKTDLFQIVREDLKPARIVTSDYSAKQSRYRVGKQGSITGESKDPWCVIRGANGGEKQWLVVEALPGEEIELSFFVERLTYEFPSSRRGETSKSYWISSLDSVEGKNAIDLTPLLFDFDSFSVPKPPALSLGPNNPLVRRINALDENNVYLSVEESGTYRILEGQESGAKAKYRFILLENAFRYSDRIPQLQSPEEPFELTSGIYIFNFAPEKRGILHFVVYRDGGETEESQARCLREAQRLLEGPPKAATGSFVWPKVEVHLNRREPTVLLLNERINVPTGLVVRELPLDLSDPLSFRLQPGQSVEIQATAKEDSILSVDGTDLGLEVDSQQVQSNAPVIVPRGEFTLRLTNRGKTERLCCLGTTPRQGETLPPLPEMRPLEQQLPLITEGRPIFADYQSRETKHFLLRVEEPALYRIETSGRLAMGLTVRTPLVTSLFKNEQNGVGRNALIQSYLKPGYYLVQAGTLGSSKGRAGLHLHRNPLKDAGTLMESLVSRRTVEADQALRYRIAIQEPGRYRLSTYGLGTTYDCRLEDAEGWPIGTAAGNGEVTREFEPGTYYYYTLPRPLKTRRLTFIEKIDQKPPQEGSLLPNRKIEHLWRESPERTPDVYRLFLTAPLEASIFLTKGMVARLLGPGRDPSAELFGGRQEPLSLESGEYELEVRSIDENDRFSYTILLSTSWLIPGELQRVSSTPATIPVSLGSDQHCDIWSFGKSDIRATLWDSDGHVLLAESDDRMDDWNFHISRKLKAGLYTLKVEKVGHWGGPCTVYMESRPEQPQFPAARPLPFEHETSLGRSVLSIPITTGPQEGLVQILAQALEPVSIALYAGERVLAAGENALYIPLRGNTGYILKVWHQGDIPTTVRLEAREMTSEYEGSGKKILEGDSVSLSLPLSWVHISNGSGLSYYYRSDNRGRSGPLLYSPGLERECLPIGWSAENTARGSGWLVDPDGKSIGTVLVEPLRLSSGMTTSVLLGELSQSFLVENLESRALLLEVTSPGLITGATVTRQAEYDSDRVVWEGMHAVASKTLVGILEPGSYQGRVWRTEPEEPGSSLTARRVNVTPRSYPLQYNYSLGKEKPLQFSVEPQRAVTIGLENRPSLLRLLLSRGLVAFVWQNGRSEVLVSAQERNTSSNLAASGGKLIVVNTGDRPALARAQALNKDLRQVFSSKIRLTPGAGFEEILREDGTLTFELPPAAGDLRLCVAGDRADALLRGRNGKYYRGNAEQEIARSRSEQGERGLISFQVFPYSPGELVVSHGKGLLRVWAAERDEIDRAFVHRDTEPDFSRLKADILVEGETRLSGESRMWSFSLEETEFVRIETEAPGISALYAEGKIVAVSASGTQEGSQISRFLKSGSYRLYSRAVAGGSMEGTLRFTRVKPVPLEGGEGELRLIGPSEVQAFRFDVRAAGKVGIGLKSESDCLSIRLFDQSLCLIGSGALLFEQLKEGTYLLVVDGGGETVQYRPVLLGLDGSLRKAPKETIRLYAEETVE